MILLNDEENPYCCKDGSHLLSGEDKYCYQAFNEGAKAQLKKVMGHIEKQSCNAACEHWKRDLLQALLKEIEGYGGIL